MGEPILLIEDDEALGAQVVEHLSRAGFEPTWLKRGDDLDASMPPEARLVVLDLMLPGRHGLDVLKELRESSDVPVLVLSAKNDSQVKVRALKLGADDYMVKPFWPEELVERVRARLRRPVLARSGIVEVGLVRLDLEARQAWTGEREVELTRVEFDILAALARRPGVAVTRQWLVDHVLDPERGGTERTLDVHVSRLRRKLGDPCPVATVWGVGYRLETEGGA